MKMIKILGLTLAAAGMMTITAQAVPITGEIFFTGVATLNGTAATATAIDFNNPVSVNLATGSYSGLAPTTATFTDFAFGGVGTIGPLNVNPLWIVAGGWEFQLTSITVNALVGSQRNIEGNGLARGPVGFDETAGHWTLSTSGSTTIVTFSSATTAVPDGGSTLILLGSAIVGLFGVARKSLRIA